MINEQKIFDRIKTLWLDAEKTEEQKEKRQPSNRRLSFSKNIELETAL